MAMGKIQAKQTYEKMIVQRSINNQACCSTTRPAPGEAPFSKLLHLVNGLERPETAVFKFALVSFALVSAALLARTPPLPPTPHPSFPRPRTGEGK